MRQTMYGTGSGGCIMDDEARTIHIVLFLLYLVLFAIWTLSWLVGKPPF